MTKLSAILLAVSFAAGCAADSGKAPTDDSFTDLAGLGGKSDAFSAKLRILGDLTYGQSAGAIAVTGKPKYRGYTFTGHAGDAITVDVVSQDGSSDPVAWVLDANFNILAKNDDASATTSNSHVATTLPASTSAVHYIVFREMTDSKGTFGVTLQGTAAVVPTTCTLVATPTTGHFDTSFAWALTSTNATSCSYTFDGSAPVTVNCTESLGGMGSALGAGFHDVAVTAVGPGGAVGTCDSMVEVIVPSCTTGMVPSNGTVNDNFQLDVDVTNATTCTTTIDGVLQAPVPGSVGDCNFAQAEIGAGFGVGTHTAVVTGDDGQGGTTSCQTSWTVTDATM